jgi:hypothetical protein
MFGRKHVTIFLGLGLCFHYCKFLLHDWKLFHSIYKIPSNVVLPVPNTTTYLSSDQFILNQSILVIFSGPTSLDTLVGKNELYIRNLDFFLQFGVDCRYQDTVISLSPNVETSYRDTLTRMHQNCQALGHSVFILLREEEECHDLPTLYNLFYGSSISTKVYEYFVYLNCGMTGPAPSMRGAIWLEAFLKPLSRGVHMSGISVNCFRKNSPHVQSMAYALDRVGLEIVLESGSIFDCKVVFAKNESNRFNKIVMRYERGISKAILNKGFGLASIVWPGVVFWENRTNCTLVDPWGEENLKLRFGGRLPYLNETIFFKSSRLLPHDIAKLIGYDKKPSWHSD